jgi:hypothetical protein
LGKPTIPQFSGTRLSFFFSLNHGGVADSTRHAECVTLDLSFEHAGVPVAMM